MMTTYVALLRGINVGGNNLIKMPALKACFETKGFEQVRTSIQNGTVIFVSPEPRTAALPEQIESMLAATFKYPPTVVVRSQKQMRAIVDKAPKGFGAQPAKYLY